MKKIVAILLVVALMSAMFVVPAHAHETEGVSPRVAPDACPRCQSDLTQVTRTYPKGVTVSNCPVYDYSHNHTEYYKNSILRICTNSSCTYVYVARLGELVEERTYCPYA